MGLDEKAMDDMGTRSRGAVSSRWWLREDSRSIVIGSTPEGLYEMVADLTRMGEWSPECQRVEWVDRSGQPVEGARFVGHNKGGPGQLMKWSRQGRVLAADPGRELAFVTEEGGRESTEWRYRFERVDGGTRVTESYKVWRIPMWARILDVPTNRARELGEHMKHTLEHLKSSAEAAPSPR